MSFNSFNGAWDGSFTAIGKVGPVVPVITEFGYKTATLGSPGGYGSSEAWIVNPLENPSNNELAGTTYTAKEGDKVTKLFVQSALSQDDVDNGRHPIAELGIYENNAALTLVKQIRFDGEKALATKWNEITVDVPLEAGKEYVLAINPNGWTKWPEFNPDDGNSDVYALTTSGTLEDLGGLSKRSSSWMIPFYAEVTSGGSTVAPTIKPAGSTIFPKPTTSNDWVDSDTWTDSDTWSE